MRSLYVKKSLTWRPQPLNLYVRQVIREENRTETSRKSRLLI